MVAAIRDGVRAAPRANIRAATPFALPKDLARRARLPRAVGARRRPRDSAPPITRRTCSARSPITRAPGAEVVIEGENLHDRRRARRSPRCPITLDARRAGRARGATAPHGFVPSDASVYLGTSTQSRPVDGARLDRHARSRSDPGRRADRRHQADRVHRRQAASARSTSPSSSKKDTRYHDADAVALDPDEKAYVEAILAELKNVAQRDKVPELEEFAKKIEKLLDEGRERRDHEGAAARRARARPRTRSTRTHEPNPRRSRSSCRHRQGAREGPD